MDKTLNKIEMEGTMLIYENEEIWEALITLKKAGIDPMEALTPMLEKIRSSRLNQV